MTVPSSDPINAIPDSTNAQVSQLLASLEQLDVSDHPNVYEQIDQLLREQLSARASTDHRPGADQ